MSKIIHLARYYEPHLGGVETHIRELNKHLLNKGHEIVVVCEEHEENLPEEALIDGVKVLRMPVFSFKSKLLFFGFLNKLYYKIKVWTWIARHGQLLVNAEVIHAHDVFWWIWPIYPFVYFKTFLTFHGWEGKHPISIFAKAHRYYNAMSAKKTIHIGKFIQNFYWDKPTEIIFGAAKDNLLKEPLMTPSLRDEKYISNASQIVFVGRLEDVNELQKTLSFLRLLKDKYPKIKITFVGDGKWRQECEQLGQVTGFVKNPDHYLKEADLICANSYLSILDSQALGKLVCAFYSNPVKESYLKTFNGAQYMIIENEPTKMTERLEKITSKQAGLAARKIKNFAQTQTWKNVANAYLKLWEMISEKN